MKYFETIATIPRPSKKEEKIRKRLLDRANKKWFETKEDAAWNVVISVASTTWREDEEVVILQSHMDMVCVKTLESDHNFMTDPISLVTEWDRMTADGTTLWADNGIWLAMSLAACSIESHPALEILVTVDEEEWLNGALDLDPSIISWKLLINLDTEDLGEICISSAGGWRIDVTHTLHTDVAKYDQYKFSLTWFVWWHSWVDIDKNRWNAIYEYIKLIVLYTDTLEVSSISGWVADNAIPWYCTWVIWIKDREVFESYITSKINELQEKFENKDIWYTLEASTKKQEVITNILPVLEKIIEVDTWVQSMSTSISWLVQTSKNLGILSIKDKKLQCTYAPRSSDMPEHKQNILTIKEMYESIWCTVTSRSIYPWRQQDPNDPLVLHTKKRYEQVYWSDVEIVAYHAWLECGALVEKMWPWAQAVSFGPTILDPHSPSERCHLPSVKICCDTLDLMLKNPLK